MLEKPKFKPHFHVEVAPDEDVVYLLSEKRHYALRGLLYRAIAPFLDGTHAVNDIEEKLKAFVSEASIRYALERLETQGYLVDAADAPADATAAFWHLHGIDPNQANWQKTPARVALHTFGEVQAEPFAAQLSALGIQPDHAGELAVALVDDYLQDGLREFNQERLQAGSPWLLVKPVGAVLWIGPLFIPGETGCWYCLAHRLAEHRKVESSLQYQIERSAPFPVSRAMLPSTLQTGCALAATQVALCLADIAHSPLKGTIITLDAATLQTDKHILSKRPQCPICGMPHDEEPRPLQLQSRKKFFTEDGGHRICSPTETFKRYGHLISPITGIVTELRQMFTDANGLITMYAGIHRLSLVNRNYAELQRALRNNSTGKGRSDLQSRASAFSEAVERYSAIYQGHEFRIRMPYSQADERFIPIERCMLFSEEQYRCREEWNRSHLSLEHVPIRLDPETPIDWTPVWSCTAQTVKYVPTAYCYLRYTDPADGGDLFYSVESNGFAAGNVLEEAILQAFFEVVERDSVSIWWYNRLQRPAVDLDSFHDSYFDALREYYAALSRELWVLDLTTDSTIPTYAAISRTVGREDEMLTFGYGTHFDVRIALSRALTEMNQSLYLMESGRMAERARSEREQFMKDWNRTGRLEHLPYLAPDRSVPAKTRSSYSEWYREDILDDLERCFEITRNLGAEFLVNDVTRPDIGMSVVKVIVPGLRHIRARFAPGRLYDVPVKLGWIPKPISESEMNPITIWM
ncbi:YcaO-like family protein [Candidatus Moduliflexus flocculans]|uniref:YcaO-like family protein n=1 Tax=Candidatus Moduliflexus flocculans TaxID=1499966 RepID=A0A081BM49_9BACT|nr:YcaO-like family protein [Candidatus Moduliflexus flocculans]